MTRSLLIPWTAFALFALAVVLVVLAALAPGIAQIGLVLSDGVIWVAGVLALLSTVLGFVSFRSPPGKIAAIGGVVLLLAVLVLIPTSTSISG